MNLPRHTLTSHGPEPTFANAHFANVTAHGYAGPGPLKSTSGDTSQYTSRPIPLGSEGHQADQVPKKDNVRARFSSTDSKSVQRHSAAAPSTSSRTRNSNPTSSQQDPGFASVSMVACATRQGFFVAQTDPLRIRARRDFPSTQGGLAHAVLIDDTSMLVLVGGGRVPRFAPNKVILWDEDLYQSPIPVGTNSDEDGDSIQSVSPDTSTLFSMSREEEKEEKVGQSLTSESERDRNQDKDHVATSTAQRSIPTMDSSQEEALEAHTSLLEQDAPIPSFSSSSQYQGTPAPTIPPSHHEARESHLLDVRPSKERRGAVVAELEFAEAVRNVHVATFVLPEKDGSVVEKASLLVITLQQRVVIFELGSHIPSAEHESWGVLQRMVIDIHPGSANCRPSLVRIPETSCVLLALPGRQKGHILLLSLALSHTRHTSLDSSIAGASSIIAAHSSAIASITLSDDAKTLCSASEQGTLLRIWSMKLGTQTGSNAKRLAHSSLQAHLVGELRRGTQPATILSVAIDPDSRILAAASDKGTIHLFDLDLVYQARMQGKGAEQHAANMPSASTSSIFGKQVSKYLPSAFQEVTRSIPASMVPHYLQSQWSFAQYRIPLQIFTYRATEGGPRFQEHAPRHGKEREKEKQSPVGDAILPTPPERLEGGWDTMRTRIKDIQRGERTTEERIWLTWIPCDDNRRQSSDEPDAQVETQIAQATNPFELVAITSSGSHYRLGICAPEAHDQLPEESVVLDMYRGDASKSHRAKDSLKQQGKCWLIEHKRFGMRDAWVDQHL